MRRKSSVRYGRSRQRGGSVVELAFVLPWYFFLFVGVFDWGYYSHALVSTQAAARTAVLYTSQNSTTANDQATACTYALDELKISANLASTTSCNSDPLIVSASKVTSGPDGNSAASVTVSYHTLSLIPIPSFLAQQVWIVQTVEMRLRG